jgi:14-3-3 protein epsilon
VILSRRGDYARYLTEIATSDHQREIFSETSLASYTDAHMLARKALPSTHVTRLGLSLNFSVYFYDVRRSPDKACHLAKNAFDNAIYGLSVRSADDENGREALTILQLIRSNLTLWCEEMELEEVTSPV